MDIGDRSNDGNNYINQSKVSQYLEQQDLFNKLMSERGIHIKRVNPENQSNGSSGQYDPFSGIASFGESSGQSRRINSPPGVGPAPSSNDGVLRSV